jgi:flavin-binding protein dodecin
MTSDHVYKIVELVGSSPEGIEQAVENAVSRASQTLSDLDWFEVKEIRGNIHEGKIQWYQVKLDIGFRVLDPAELGRD